MTAGCQWLSLEVPPICYPGKCEDTVMWKRQLRRPVRWCVWKEGAKPARDSHLEERRTVMLLREARKTKKKRSCNKTDLPPALKCWNSSCSFLRSQMWGRTFLESSEKDALQLARVQCQSLDESLLSKCSPHPAPSFISSERHVEPGVEIGYFAGDLDNLIKLVVGGRFSC